VDNMAHGIAQARYPVGYVAPRDGQVFMSIRSAIEWARGGTGFEIDDPDIQYSISHTHVKEK